MGLFVEVGQYFKIFNYQDSQESLAFEVNDPFSLRVSSQSFMCGEAMFKFGLIFSFGNGLVLKVV